MWARVHKVDRVKPLPAGGAVIFIEDERTPTQVARNPPLSTLIAVARVLDARQVLDAKLGGKGEVRYMTTAGAPSFLLEAVARAGAHAVERERDRVELAAQPGSVESLVDVAFSDLAHRTKAHLNLGDLATALRQLEQTRKKAPLERESPLYWPAVFELAALAGELSRPRRARWVEVREMPVPFALKFPDSSALAHPTAVAQRLVEGREPEAPIVEPGDPGDPT